jgi:ferredoxin
MSDARRTAARVNVNPHLCIGSGTCVAVAPTLFDIGDDGSARPLPSAIESGEKLNEAISRCPTGAIEVTADTATE